jgi:hypothetical protein
MHVRIRRAAARPAILLGVVLAAGLLVAQSSAPAAAYTEEQQAACEGDAMRLCGQFIPDIPRITACMKRNCRLASARCRAVMRCGRARRR